MKVSMALCAPLLLVPALLAQKKPITLETLQQARRFVPTPIWAPDGRSFAYIENRALWIYGPPGKTSKRLVGMEALDSAATPSLRDEPESWTNRRARTGGLAWSRDGKSLLYGGRGDLFLIRAATGKWDQLTKTPAAEIDPQLSPDGSHVAFLRGSDLYALDLESRRETRLTSNGSPTLLNGGLDWVYPEELDLATAFWWSPDSRSIAYLQFDTSGEPLYPHEDLLGVHAVFEPEPYPQAGQHNARIRLGVVPAAGGATRWFDLGDTQDAYLIARAGWMPDSRHLYAIRMNRVQNRLEALAIDTDSAAETTLFRESDPYWINLRGDLQFLKDGRRFLWTSERTGSRHIYLYSNDGKQVRQLTHGDWEVTAIAGVDEAGGRVFYTSSEPTHLEQQLYEIGLDGRNQRRLTAEPGTHRISMGPGGAYYLDAYSSLSTPPVTTLHAGDGRDLGVYREPDPSLNAYDILPSEMTTFRGPDGTLLYGRFIRPAGFEASKKYPAIVSVYGGPDAPLPVRNAWYGISLEQVLAHHGYVVWQAENRGGAGRGHAFETPIFHKLGVSELADQVAGVKHLVSLGFVDPARIGIYGWSYGGFMTVNALLNAPSVFHAGFAGAPVTNWRDYDSIYTERYMGLPDQNADGYRETGLPARAANLSGKLLVAHNFEDDNVLFQNTLQLTAALQAAHRQFQLMVYPGKTHDVRGPDAAQMNEMMIEFFDRSLK